MNREDIYSMLFAGFWIKQSTMSSREESPPRSEDGARGEAMETEDGESSWDVGEKLSGISKLSVSEKAKMYMARKKQADEATRLEAMETARINEEASRISRTPSSVTGWGTA
jgi:hypothetical protein